MGRQTQTRVIGGHTYEVSQLPARAAVRLFNLLVKVAAPEVGRLLGGAEAAKALRGGSLGDADVSVLGEIVGGLAGRLDDATWERVEKDLLEGVLMDGRSFWPAYDAVLQGRVDELYQLVWFALEVNYGDFFGKLLRAAGSAAQAQAASGSTSPTTSPGSGPSGGS